MNERKTKIPEPVLTYAVRERGPHALKGPCSTCKRDPCCFAFFELAVEAEAEAFVRGYRPIWSPELLAEVQALLGDE